MQHNFTLSHLDFKHAFTNPNTKAEAVATNIVQKTSVNSIYNLVLEVIFFDISFEKVWSYAKNGNFGKNRNIFV
jgi:hypothetical protein